MTDFKNQLAKFIGDNNITGITAGVCIGIASKEVITSLIGDVVIPLIIVLMARLNIRSLTLLLPGKGKNILNITNFISQFISWLLIVVLTFLFIQYAFVKLLGVTK